MIDFPSNPTVNQLFPAGNTIYQFDGVAWNVFGSIAIKLPERDNILINPAVQVSQENGTTEGTGTLYYPADQWQSMVNAPGAAIGSALVLQNNPSGSVGRLRYRVTTAKASLAAAEYSMPYLQLVEGTRIRRLGWHNAAKSKPALFTFGFNGPAGTYSLSIRSQPGGAYSFVKSFVISAAQAGTDVVVVIPIPPPPTTSWTTDGTAALSIGICIGAGSQYTAPSEGWNAGNYMAAPGTSNGLAAVQSFFAWDFGFYADPDNTGIAPPFVVPDYDDDLEDCKRYFQRFINLSVYSGYAIAGNGVWQNFVLPVQTRVVPTGTLGWRTGSNANAITMYDADSSHVRIGWTAPAAGASYGFFDVNLNARM